MELELKCKCGATAKITKPEDSNYTENEGWYTGIDGDIDVYAEHDQAFFKCNKCGNEIWIFT